MVPLNSVNSVVSCLWGWEGGEGHSYKGVVYRRLWNPQDFEIYTGLVSRGASLTSWGEGVSLALVGLPSIDGVTIKMPYGVDALHWPVSHPKRLLHEQVKMPW